MTPDGLRREEQPCWASQEREQPWEASGKSNTRTEDPATHCNVAVVGFLSQSGQLSFPGGREYVFFPHTINMEGVMVNRIFDLSN